MDYDTFQKRGEMRMELEIDVQVLQQAEEQLSSCSRAIRACTEDIEKTLLSLEQSMDDDTGYELRSQLRKYERNMIDHYSKLQMLYLSLEQIRRLYGRCEEEIAENSETHVKRTAECLKIQNIKDIGFLKYPDCKGGEEYGAEN